MKRLYLPILFDGNTVAKNWGWIISNEEGIYHAYVSEKDAVEKAKELALSNPKAKVVILVSDSVLEARSIEFSEKKYSKEGELLV